MRFFKKVEIVDIFRIQVRRSTFVKFQLKIDENNLNVNKFGATISPSFKNVKITYWQF